jgi:nitroimidazol reductase NimA-like FMN-containing flavoprotein (pyridoxamine 5'-phosphate oxidase superfamily)
MKALVDKAKQIIADNIYMTVATASPDGKPWISPVFFAYDLHYNLLWVSYKDSLHSKLIRQNPRVAIVIFDSRAPEGDGDAVYIEAQVAELENLDEIQSAIGTLGKRVTKDEFRVNSVDDVTKAAAWRIYKASPTAVSKLHRGEFVNGQYVDKRIEIDLQ